MAARIAELERQRDAVLALCDEHAGHADGCSLVVDEVVAIYGGGE